MPPQPHQQPAARIVLFTADACIAARVATNGERVKDALNAPSTVLELASLTYSSPDRPGVPLADYPAGIVRKADIACVIVLAEPPLESLRKIGTFVQKRPVALSVIVPGMVVTGTIHTQGRFDPMALLMNPPEQFIPLTDASIIRAQTAKPASLAPDGLTIFVNRTHVSGVMFTDQDEAEPAAQRRGTGMLHPQARGAGAIGHAAPRPGLVGSPGTNALPAAPARPGTGTLSSAAPYPGTGSLRPAFPTGVPAPTDEPKPQQTGTGRLRRLTGADPGF